MSKIFITVEAQDYVAHDILKIIHTIEHKLSNINLSDYTDILTNITIVVNCFEDSWIKLGFGKERKYISYKNQFADIRINIPYNEFIEANEREKYLMVVKIVLMSIKVVNNKTNKKIANSFNGEQMLEDIKTKLYHTSHTGDGSMYELR